MAWTCGSDELSSGYREPVARWPQQADGGPFERHRTHCVDEHGHPSYLDVRARPDRVVEISIGGRCVAVCTPEQVARVRAHLRDALAVALWGEVW